MNKRLIIVFFALILLLVNLQLIAKKSLRLPKILDDNYGKVEGYIIDFETGAQVQEQMIIFIYSYPSETFPSHLYTTETDKKGRFSFKLIPSKYCLYCSPNTENSRYCSEPIKGDFLENLYEMKTLDHIIVNKGQITKVVKKAYRGGGIKLFLIDENGNSIDPSERFYKDVNIHGNISSQGILIETSFTAFQGDYSFNDGEVEIKSLYPEKYRIRLTFPYIGYGDANFFVVVGAGQVVEKKVVIDITNNTGVEGIVNDTNGIPIKGITVIVGTNGFWGIGSDITDQNGYYKIVNIIPGKNRIYFNYESDNGRNFSKNIEVDIQQNVLTRKNVILIIE